MLLLAIVHRAYSRMTRRLRCCQMRVFYTVCINSNTSTSTIRLNSMHVSYNSCAPVAISFNPLFAEQVLLVPLKHGSCTQNTLRVCKAIEAYGLYLNFVIVFLDSNLGNKYYQMNRYNTYTPSLDSSFSSRHNH